MNSTRGARGRVTSITWGAGAGGSQRVSSNGSRPHELEIGCGTGAITATILAESAPRSIVSIDSSKDFVAYARSAIDDKRVRFEVADAQRLRAKDASIDVVTSALVLNFIPDKPSALAEMKRVLKPNGVLSFYVWDYPGGRIGFIDAFWKAATEVDQGAGALDEGKRFLICTRDGLAAICRQAGLRSLSIEPIETETLFPDFEAFWQPFTLGAGPAPGYCISLAEDHRALLKARLAVALGIGAQSISLRARGRLKRVSQNKVGCCQYARPHLSPSAPIYWE